MKPRYLIYSFSFNSGRVIDKSIELSLPPSPAPCDPMSLAPQKTNTRTLSSTSREMHLSYIYIYILYIYIYFFFFLNLFPPAGQWSGTRIVLPIITLILLKNNYMNNIINKGNYTIVLVFWSPNAFPLNLYQWSYACFWVRPSSLRPSGLEPWSRQAHRYVTYNILTWEHGEYDRSRPVKDYDQLTVNYNVSVSINLELWDNTVWINVSRTGLFCYFHTDLTSSRQDQASLVILMSWNKRSCFQRHRKSVSEP